MADSPFFASSAALDETGLRTFVYDHILTGGRPPSCLEIGNRFGISATEARRALGALRLGKTILVDAQSGEIWMAGPFSARETPYRVVDGKRAWWANCAWDMFGVAHIANTAVTVHTFCGDCGAAMAIPIDPATPPPNDIGVVHFLVPARHWYDDIGFT